jgi:hypothetical protein
MAVQSTLVPCLPCKVHGITCAMTGLHALIAGVTVAVGAIDPTCTLQKVCVPGYTQTVRPSASYTNALKRRQMKVRGLPGNPGEYEEDHIIPLELCGNPTDPNNLTPEKWDRARAKDQMENLLHKRVCAGAMTLQAAQAQVVTYE